jgi:hypothetical protein
MFGRKTTLEVGLSLLLTPNFEQVLSPSVNFSLESPDGPSKLRQFCFAIIVIFLPKTLVALQQHISQV